MHRSAPGPGSRPGGPLGGVWSGPPGRRASRRRGSWPRGRCPGPGRSRGRRRCSAAAAGCRADRAGRRWNCRGRGKGPEGGGCSWASASHVTHRPRRQPPGGSGGPGPKPPEPPRPTAEYMDARSDAEEYRDRHAGVPVRMGLLPAPPTTYSTPSPTAPAPSHPVQRRTNDSSLRAGPSLTGPVGHSATSTPWPRTRSARSWS